MIRLAIEQTMRSDIADRALAWLDQRIDAYNRLHSATAESVRRKLPDPALAPLFDILAEHRVTLKCQFDAFSEYVAAAEEHGVENYPLYQWTKATIENPAKREKYLKSFTLWCSSYR
jgi:hypothetical protein